VLGAHMRQCDSVAMSKQSSRERQMWTEHVRKLEERKNEKKVKRPRAKKKPEPSPAELEAALDDLTEEPKS
jgi:hypothetical protein